MSSSSAARSSLDEQATIEAVSGAPHLVDTWATAEDVALLIADHRDGRPGRGRRPARAAGVRSSTDSSPAGPAASPPGSSSVTGWSTSRRSGALHGPAPAPLQVFAVVLAGLVALLAAISVTPVGQGWAHDVVDYLQGLL